MRALTCYFIYVLLLFISPVFAQDDKPKIPEDTKVLTTESGLQYCVLKDGPPAPHPMDNDTVTVHYSGWLENGTLFNTSQGKDPVQFMLHQVIKGWSEGLKLMTPGSIFKLIIPSSLAYGATGKPPRIPKNANLIFKVELVSIIPGPKIPEFREGNPDAQKKTESGLVYEVITPGKGEIVQIGDNVQIKFALWIEDKTLVTCSELLKQIGEFQAGQARIAVLNEGVLLMKKGAHFRFEAPPELAFGERGDGRKVGPNAKTIWEIRLLDIKKPLPVPDFALPAEGKAVTTESGLKYEIIKEGEGESPKVGDSIIVHYAGWLPDGKGFDNSYSFAKPRKVILGGKVIPGWIEGLPLMKEGAVYRFYIPAKLAYGDDGLQPVIPPGSALVFYIELIKVGS